MILNGVEEAKG